MTSTDAVEPETVSPDPELTLDRFDYDLPPGAIAQTPVEPRDAARMLVAGAEERPLDTTVARLDEFLRPGDTLVVNNTRVIPARLALTKPTGGAAEVFLLEPTGRPNEWQAMVRPSRRLPVGMELMAGGRPLVTVGEVIDEGRRLVLVDDDALALAGQVPLPPYITAPLADPDRYQTVFADREGSVAAPTAGLHLTPALLGRIKARGVAVETVELKVGIGTFRPITADRIGDHIMHAERYSVRPDAWERIQAADRVVAVGTTVVRTLESVGAGLPLEGSTDLFIRRGYDWAVVDALLTNFHMPRSSLLVLVDAFFGPGWIDLYRQALGAGYRFLSFGDCMLLERDAGRDRAGEAKPSGEGDGR